jgi:hypothetical protein
LESRRPATAAQLTATSRRPKWPRSLVLKSKLPKPALGAYDLIVYAEAASDEAIAKFVLSLAAKGNLRTTTVKVFPEAEYEKIVAAIA